MRARPNVLFVAGLLLGVGVLAGVGGAVATGTARAPRTPVRVEEAPPAPPVTAAEIRRAADDPALRAAVQRAMASAVTAQRHDQEVDDHLAEIERAARARGEVKADEVVDGLQKIEMAHPGDMERAGVFARRMEALQRELNQPATSPGDPPTEVSVQSLLQIAARTPAGPARDQMIPQIVTAIGRLPVEERDEASKALDRVTANP